jgi:hypothetical protein
MPSSSRSTDRKPGSYLLDLLDRYAEYGVNQLDDLAVLGMPPLDELGYPVEIEPGSAVRSSSGLG